MTNDSVLPAMCTDHNNDCKHARTDFSALELELLTSTSNAFWRLAKSMFDVVVVADPTLL